jgi:hypothetical protein
LLWADQLLDALEYLHSQKPPIIHRDIKPQNLKLTPRGEVILLDFGLAKGIVTHQSQASQSIRGYTPNYASLEQIRGTGTDSRSDIYSIGATIYHLLTGEMPQDAMTRIAAILMGQPDPLRPIAVLNPDVPAMIAAVIEKAMAPHPDQRYGSAAAMRQALRNSVNNIPPAGPHREPTLTDEPMKSHVAAVGTRLRAGTAVLQQQAAAAAAVKAVKSSDPDHVILLLDDVKQKPTKDGVRRSPSKPKQPKASSRTVSHKQAMWYGVTAFILLALTLCAIAYKTMQTGPNLLTDVAGWATTTQANVSGNASGPALAIPVRVEVLRYYLELASSGNKNSNELTRATGLMPLEGGTRFKFHFKPAEEGYLYILALGKNGVPQTFLTSQPMAASGATTNWSAAGGDFQFPDGGQWFMIQKDADNTPFTVIFSKTPLTAPAFLSSQSGRDLTAAEQQELMEMKKLYAANAPALVAMADTVQVSAERAANEPVIFDISINRKK